MVLPFDETAFKYPSNDRHSLVFLTPIAFVYEIDLSERTSNEPNTISVPASINHMMEAVKLALSHIPYEFSEHLCDNTSFYQMTSCFANGPIHRWYFHFLSDNTFGTVDHELSTNLLSLISKEMKSDDKISFVTSIPLLFQYYMEHRPHNLNLNLSFILINEHTLTVSKEIVLQTASSIPYEVLNNYTFPSNPE